MLLAQIILLLFATLQVALSFLLMRGSRALALSLFLALNGIFYLIPTFFWFFDPGAFSYALQGRVATTISGQYEVASLIYVIGVNIIIIAQSGLLLIYSNKLPSFGHQNAPSLETRYYVLPILLVSLVAVMVHSLSLHGFDFYSAFTIQYRDTRSFQSTLVQKIFFTMAYVYLGLSYIQKGFRFRRGDYLVILMVVLLAMGTGQRREILSIIIFLFALSVLARTLRGSRREPFFSRVPISLRLLLIAATMVGLWYARVIATSGTALDRILEIRSPFQVLFGSISTGFPALNLIFEYTDEFGYQLLLPLQLFVNFIPRALWPNKPIVLPDQIQNDMNLLANPSVFFYGDMFAWLGFFSLVFVPLLVYALHHFSKAWRSGRVDNVLLSAYATSCAFILFKNGVVSASFHILLFFIFLKITLALNNTLLSRRQAHDTK